MSDLALGRNLKKGSKGDKVKLVQEWLCLHGFNIAVDGDFGAATDYAVRQFQRKKHLKGDGIVGPKTFAKLVGPMKNALRSIPRDGRSLGQMVVAYAKQHANEHPREVGGSNRGPWVRRYMNGHEGPAWAWCAGFACFVLNQACRSVGATSPIGTSFSCSVLANRAKRKGIFLRGSEKMDTTQIKPGSLFLKRGGKTGWRHTGLVTRAGRDVLLTIE